MDRKRILVIDDDPLITALVKMNLEAAGNYEVWETTQPAIALMTAKRFKPDLIFLDLTMPDIDGSTLAAEFKTEASLKDIPVVFLTGMVTRNDGVNGKIVGQHIYMAKPINFAEMIAFLERVLH